MSIESESASHFHVGHNVPGYLPESPVTCFDDINDAVEAVREEIKNLQELYYQQCDTLSGIYGDSDPEWCKCSWCDAATDCAAALSKIADGDLIHALEGGNGQLFFFRPDHGPDEVMFIGFGEGVRSECKLVDNSL